MFLGIDFANLPNYAYVLFGIVVALIIYSILPQESRLPIRKFLKNHGVPIFIILIWICMRDQLGSFAEGEWFAEKANTFGILILLLYYLGVNFLGKERYESTQAIANNKSGSCMDYEIIGDYVLLNIGSVKRNVFSWIFGHETWCVPKRLFKKIDKKKFSKSQILCLAKIFKSDLMELPVFCREFLEGQKNFNKENIFYGEASQEELEYLFKDENNQKDNKMKKVIEELELKLRDRQRMLNEARDMIKGKTSSIKGFVSDANAIQKSANGGFFRRPERDI